MPRTAAPRLHRTRDLVIRRAGPRDAAVLARLVHQLNAHQGDPTDRFDACVARRDLLTRTAPARVLLAELDGQPAGYALLMPAYESAHAARGFYVADFFVTEAARARGVGRALMAACADEARRRGTTFLWWVSKAWNVEAQDFYRKLGAVEEPVMAHALTFERFATMADEGTRQSRSVRRAGGQIVGRKRATK